MDFMHDLLADGRTLRLFTLVDVFTRECLALEAGWHVRGADVTAHLSAVVVDRGGPAIIQCDQDTEFTSLAVDKSAYWHYVQLDFSRRGTPGDNAVCQAVQRARETYVPLASLFLDPRPRSADVRDVESGLQQRSAP